MPAKKEITFEKAMERLDEIVNMLENGNYPLDKSLEFFEEGIKLVNFCNSKLDFAENKVKELVNIDGEFVEKDFDIGVQDGNQ